MAEESQPDPESYSDKKPIDEPVYGALMRIAVLAGNAIDSDEPELEMPQAPSRSESNT